MRRSLRFEPADWWDQLTANYGTGENILADLTVEGVTYPEVGVRFRGNTSYTRTGDSEKKSFNIELDFVDEDQDLMGYRTLNLHNAYLDPSFMREVLYFHEARNYVPTP
ncbi:MAG: CotH kinase family protein, partial [Candidatus Latescibacteria bacterium]|nr:CotH kinase family protein [Candidatus Latescibacterota bacterium]